MMMIRMMVMMMIMISIMVMMTSCMLHCISLARAACLDAIQLLQNVLSPPRLVGAACPLCLAYGQGGHDNGDYLY